MNRDDVIRLAREAGFRVGPSRDGPDDVWGVSSNLVRFAELIRDDEREACAQMVEDLNDIGYLNDSGHSYGLENRIRARGGNASR